MELKFSVDSREIDILRNHLECQIEMLFDVYKEEELVEMWDDFALLNGLLDQLTSQTGTIVREDMEIFRKARMRYRRGFVK